jgi:hypothetical protein
LSLEFDVRAGDRVDGDIHAGPGERPGTPTRRYGVRNRRKPHFTLVRCALLAAWLWYDFRVKRLSLDINALNTTRSHGKSHVAILVVVIAGIARVDFRVYFGYGLLYAVLWFVVGVVVFTFAPC